MAGEAIEGTTGIRIDRLSSMSLHTIPYQDKFLIYRPLRRLAFIGNRAMAEFCRKLYRYPEARPEISEQQAYIFLNDIGFLEEDQPPPDSAGNHTFFQPTICVLFPSTACNLRCIYCYAQGGDNRTDTLPWPLARSAIDCVCQNAKNLGQEKFTLCFHGGGEPTMAWQCLKESVTHARRQELPASINLTSNGVWTAQQRRWIMANIDEISLSFDGPAAIQNRQRPRRSGKGSHKTVMTAIEEMDCRGKSYGIRVTITDDSIDDIPTIINYLCQVTGVKAIQVEPAFNHGRARRDKLALAHTDRFAKAFLAGYDIACQHQRHMYYSGARPWLLTNRFCEAFTKALIVGPDGFLTACYEVCSRSHELADDFIFGMLSAENGLTIQPQVRRIFLARIEERKKTCRNCFCYYHCAGDCPSKTFAPTKDAHLIHGERCELNRTITKELLLRSIAEGDGLWRGSAHREIMIDEPLR